MPTKKYNVSALEDLLHQTLETEASAALVYQTAIRCATRDDLKSEWQEYLERARTHHEIVSDLCQAAQIQLHERPTHPTLASHLAPVMVSAMQAALAAADAQAAQRKASECVALAKTHSRQNWALLKEVGSPASGPLQQAMNQRLEEIDHAEFSQARQSARRYHELWREFLEIPAAAPVTPATPIPQATVL